MKPCKFTDIKKSIKTLIETNPGLQKAFLKGITSDLLEKIISNSAKELHVTVSEDEKIKLITYIKELLASSAYATEAATIADNIIAGLSQNTLSGVQTPDKVHGPDLDFFEVAVEKDKAFVPGINEVLSATVKQDIIVKLKSKLLFAGSVGNEKISINSEGVSHELLALKEAELTKLRTWLLNIKTLNIVKVPSVSLIMNPSIPLAERYSKYHTFMSLVATELRKDINKTPDKKITERISKPLRDNFLDALESFLLLQNFDDFVEHFIGDDVNITPKFRGDFLSLDSKKYTIKSDSYFEHSFLDDLTLDNGAHTTPHLVKLFFGTILTGGEGTEFLSNLDHRLVVSFINHMWADEHIKDSTREALRLLFTARNTELEYLALCNVLQSEEFLAKYKLSKLKALLEAITRYYNAVKNTEPDLTIEELEHFNRHRNVIHALVHSIQSLKAAVFVATTEKGNVINTAVDRSTSKKQVYDAIKVAARTNYRTGADAAVYSSVFSIAGGKSALLLTELYSDSARRMIRRILGQSISDDVLESISPDLVGNALTAVQLLYNKYVSPYSNLQEEQIEAALNNFIKALQRDLRMKLFTDKVVEKETALMLTIYTLEMDALPSENITSVLTDSERNIEEYLESFRKIGALGGIGLQDKNIILSEQLHKIRQLLSGYNDKNKFIAHSCFRSDVKIVDKPGKTKVISHTLLEPSELATVALNYDWILSVIDGDVFFLQTETYSDKPRVLIHLYNFAGKVLSKEVRLKTGLVNLIGDPFYKKSITTLQQHHFELQNAYYRAIELDIVNHWNALSKYLKSPRFNSIDDILDYLSTGVSYSTFKLAVRDYQLDPENEGNPLNFIEHYDYLNNGGKVTMNGALLYKIKTSRTKAEFLKDQEYGFQKFLENIEKNGNVPLRLSEIEDDLKLREIIGLTKELLSAEDLQELRDLNGRDLTEDELEQILEDALSIIKNAATWNPNSLDKSKDPSVVGKLRSWSLSDLFKKVLKKYHTTLALLQDADLQIGIKQPWLHIPKGVSYHDAATLNRMLQNSASVTEVERDGKKIKVNILDDIRKLEYSKRLVAGKKRNSSGVATFTPLKQGERFGVPDEMKVVMAAFPTLVVENHIGIKDKGQKPHDGSSWVFAIFSQFEENSYPNHDYLGTRKTIGLIPHFGSFTQVKHAENTLTNELLRGMAHRDVEYEFNPDNLIKVGYEPCKITKRFIHNFANEANRREIESDGIFYNFNGNIARLTKIDCDEASGTFKFTWIYNEDQDLQGEVSLTLINLMMGFAPDADNNGYVKLDNLLLLYKAFGSYNSMSYNESGNIVPSEISNIACARLISYYDADSKEFFGDDYNSSETSMKKTMVAKIIDPESCKSGLIAVNSADDLRTGNLAYGYLDTSRWGIQQDYTHETTDAKIPALTQVITAIAFNGNNVELVANLYKSLGKVIADSLRPILNMNGNSDEVNYYLGKKLIKSLLKNSVASNASELVKNFLDTIISEMKDASISEERMANGQLPVTLALSNSDLFYKVTSDLVSNLNKDTIRQEFDGIAVIQCPSQGLVMLFEDHEGNMYKRSDVVKKAQALLKGLTSIKVGLNPDGTDRFKNLQTELVTEQELIDWYCNYTEEGKSLFGDQVIDRNNIDSLNIGDHIWIGETLPDGTTSWKEYSSKDILNLKTRKNKSTGVTEFLVSDEVWDYAINVSDITGLETKIINGQKVVKVQEAIWEDINNLDQYKDPVKKNTRYGIDTPEDLRYIYKLVKNPNITIVKKFSQQRDLGVTKITWTEEDGFKNNLFCINSTTLLAASKGLDKEIKAWHRANLLGLGSKRPYYYKTIDDFKSNNPLRRTYVKDLNHKAGQQIIPKKYSLFEEGDYSLAEIRSNPNFFVDIAKRRYTISTQLNALKKYGIATSFGEIIFEDSAIQSGEINTETILDGTNNTYYITDKVGNRLLEVPGLNYKGILTTNSDGKKIMTIKVEGENASANFHDNKNGWVEKARKILDRRGLINAYYYFDGKETKVNYKLSKFNQAKSVEDNLDYIAKGLRRSWELSHTTISTRIPSQSFQSFLWTETVGYTDTTDYNLGYMNIWEMWFQGSDFDIDKAYTMMYSLDKAGKIAGNVFTDYSSIEAILESLNLPPAQYNLQAKGTHDFNELLPEIKKALLEYIISIYPEGSAERIAALGYLDTSLNTLNDLAEYFENAVNLGPEGDPIFNNSVDKYGFIKVLLNRINSLYESGITDEEKAAGYTGYFNPDSGSEANNSDLFKSLLARYAQEGQNSGKNRIVQGIVSQAESILNLEASQLPMEMGPVTDVIKDIRKAYGYDDDNLEYNEYDVYTRYIIQRANSVGKVDVGIAANGIKAAGALLLYYNSIFSGDMSDERLYGFKDPYIDINIDGVSKDGVTPGKKIVNQRFCKIANTKVPSKDKFKLIFDRAHINEEGKVDYSTDPDFLLFELLKTTKGNIDTSNLTSHLKRLVDNFKAFLDHNDNKVPDGFNLLDFSYYNLLFEDNVADYISIFISMSTDNAKELALAKIHATPELLSMPLAMITLGMDIDTVIEVCVDVLDAVHHLMASNRFESLDTMNVLDVIDALETSGSITENTALSLRNIYNFAQELRSITRFFKVNLGVTTKYSDLKAFSTSLSNDKLRLAEHTFGKNTDIPKDIIASLPASLRNLSSRDIWGLLRTPVDFYDLFLAENPLAIIDQYEVGRTVVNVMNIVMESPHFRQLLKGTSQILKFIDLNCGKARIADALLSGATLGLEEIEDRKLEGDSKEAELQLDARTRRAITGLTIDWNKVKNLTDLERLHSRALRLVDNWVIGEFIKRNPELRFSVSELEKTYPTSSLSTLGARTILRLDSEFGLHLFIRFINETFIPETLERFADLHNFFLENLVLKSHHRNDKLLYWDLKFDPYAVKDNPVLGHNFNAAAKDFEKIADIPSGIITPNGVNLTIGEVFYLYNVVTSKGLTTGLGTVAHSAGENKTVFPISKDDIYTELDAKSQLLNGEEKYRKEVERLILKKLSATSSNPFTNSDLLRLNYLTTLLELIEPTKAYFETITKELSMFVKALMDEDNSTTIPIDGKMYTLNLNDSFIETFARVRPGSLTVLTIEPIRSVRGERVECLESLEKTILNLSLNTDIKVNPTCTIERIKRLTSTGKFRGQDVFVNILLTLSSLADSKSSEVALAPIRVYLGHQANTKEDVIIIPPTLMDDIMNQVRDSIADTKMYLFSQDLLLEVSRTLDATEDDHDKFIEEDVKRFKTSDIAKEFGIEISSTDPEVKTRSLSLLQNLSTFLTRQHTIYRTKSGLPRIRKVNSKLIIILPNSTSIDANLLIDLYLESKLDNDYTLNNKLISLLQELYPKEIINLKNLYKFVKDHRAELKNNLPKVLHSYIESLIERSLQTGYLKSKVRSKLLEFSKCVNNESICYYTISKEDRSKEIGLSVGDIIQHKNGGLYLYIGNNEYGELELVLISRGTTLPSAINDNPWMILGGKLSAYLHVDSILGNPDLRIVKKLITVPSISLGNQEFPKDKDLKALYILEDSPVALKNVKIGDMLYDVLDDNWIVLDKVEAFVDIKDSETKNKKLILKLTIKNSKGEVFVINSDDTNSDKAECTIKREVFSLKLSDSVKVGRKELRFAFSSKNQVIKNFLNFSKDILLLLLAQADGYIVVNGKESLFKQIINDDYILLITDDIVNISTVLELSINASRDADLEAITESRTLAINAYAKENSIGKDDDSDLEVKGLVIEKDIRIFDSYRPENLEGTWMVHPKDDLSHIYLTPCKYIITDGKHSIGLPKVYLDDYHLVDVKSIENSLLLQEGDIIYEEVIDLKNPENSYILIHKILSCVEKEDKTGFTIVRLTIRKNATYAALNLKTGERAVHISLISDIGVNSESCSYDYIRSKKVYSKLLRVAYNRSRVLTEDSKAKKFINFLERRTGLKVMNVHAGENAWSARINNGVIEINRDKIKSDKDLLHESIHEFMHVVLGNLRLYNPTAYYEIMSRYAKTNGITETIIDGKKVYSSDLEKIEEALVKTASEHAIGIIDNNVNPSLQEILDNILDALSNEVSLFFGLTVSGQNLNKSIDSLMSRTNIFKALIGHLDLTGIRTRSIKMNVLSQILKQC